jgi:hypothetical protein
MSSQFQSNFEIKKFTIKFNGVEQNFLPNTIFSIEYNEGLDQYFTTLAVTFYDATLNFLEQIYGLEEVELEFSNTTKGFDGTTQVVTYSYTKNSRNGPLYIYEIYNVSSVGTKKTFTVGLCRLDAINDKFVKISKKFTNSKPEDIITEVLKKYIKSSKLPIVSDSSSNTLTFVAPMSAGGRLITWILDKCISESSKKDKSGKDVSAGYFFYETYDNYNFISVDKLCSQPPVNENFPYSVTQNYQPGPAEDVARDAFIIKKPFVFQNTIDVFKDLDYGFYCNKIAFFDIANQVYEERVLNLEEYYSKMTLLGKQNNLPSSVLNTFSDSKNAVTTTYSPYNNRPSRMMSIPFNSEMYSDKNQKIDFKTSIGQSLVRYGILGRQKATCTVFGNLNLRAGQVINIQLYKPGINENQAKDNVRSGNYLIYSVSHIFNNSGSGGLMYTDLKLVRDSFGA